MNIAVLRFLLLAPALLAGSLHVRAEEGTQAAARLTEQTGTLSRSAATAEIGGQMIQLLLGLLLVVGLIFLLAWLARRLQQQLPGGKRSDTIQLLATRPLGPRERLLLVQVGREQVLLGLTPGSIETLHVLQEPIAVAADEVQTAGAFAQRLKQALGQSDRDTDDKDPR